MYKAVDLQAFKTHCIIKTLNEPSQVDKNQFEKEAKALQILASLHIPLHIPTLVSFIQEDPICLVEEYVPGFTLGEELMGIIKIKFPLSFVLPFLSRKDTEEAKIFFLSICRTLKELHSKEHLHLGLKAKSIFLVSLSSLFFYYFLL